MKIATLIVFSLVIMSVVSERCYASKKAATDWDQYFKAGIAPSYPYEAHLEMTRSADEHYSYTGPTGQTQSWHCSGDESEIECADGSGLSYYLVQPNGARYFVDTKLWENDPWRMTFEMDFFLAGRAGDNAFRFRLVSQDGVDLACIQQPGTEAILNGKPRKEYAKHHRLESCYWVHLSGR